jgi:hypothetical protein
VCVAATGAIQASELRSIQVGNIAGTSLAISANRERRREHLVVLEAAV